MSIIRITVGSEGIENYFESGQKKGRKQTRDQLDKRVCLSGSLDAFSSATKFCAGHKKWLKNYWHITISFALDDQGITDDVMRNVVKDVIGYYYPLLIDQQIIYAAEAHKPKVQSVLNESENKVFQRLTHIHLAVSKLNVATGNQVRMLPFKLRADKAFQSSLALKYGLVDPTDRARKRKHLKRDFIGRYKLTDQSVVETTEIGRLRAILIETVRGVSSVEEMIGKLTGLDFFENIELNVANPKSTYYQVKTNLVDERINLRGDGFESITWLSCPDYGVKSEEKLTYAEIISNHTQWWVFEENKKSDSKQLNHTATYSRLDKQFGLSTREEGEFIILNGVGISEEVIKACGVWGKSHLKFKFHNMHGVDLYDLPDKIVLRKPEDEAQYIIGLVLMLEIAKIKNVKADIAALKLPKYAQDEVLNSLASKKIALSATEKSLVRQSTVVLSPKGSRINVVDQELYDLFQRQLHHEYQKDLVKYNAVVSAQSILDYAASELGLMKRHFSVNENNQIIDDRIDCTPVALVDFLANTCNLAIQDTSEVIKKVYELQGNIILNDEVAYESSIDDQETMQRYIDVFEKGIVDATNFKSLCKTMKKVLEVKKITLCDDGLIIDGDLLKFDQLKLKGKPDLVKYFKRNRLGLDDGFGL